MLMSAYLDSIFNIQRYAETITIMKHFLSEETFDSIAFRGTSGSAVAFPLALELNKQLLHVRKSGGHYEALIEGQTAIETYAVVDDFVETGSTIETIKDNISTWYLRAGKVEPYCTTVFLYNEDIPIGTISKIDDVFPHTVVYSLTAYSGYYLLYCFSVSNRREYTVKRITFKNGCMIVKDEVVDYLRVKPNYL